MYVHSIFFLINFSNNDIVVSAPKYPQIPHKAQDISIDSWKCSDINPIIHPVNADDVTLINNP